MLELAAMKKSVYVVDDDDDVREVLLYALEHEGYVVTAFTNGLSALNFLKKLSLDNYPGLIILDYHMPEMDGVTFINTVKKDFPQTLGSIPLAICTAEDDCRKTSSLPKEVIQLNKPMSLDDLLKVVHTHCH